jgi:hypothetical protein
MRQRAILVATATVLAVSICFVPSHLARYCLAFPLLWLLPGLGWAWLPSLRTLDRIERLVVGLGLSYVVTPIVTLLVTYLPGPVTRTALLAAIVGITGVPVALSVLTRSRRQVKQTDAGAQQRLSILTLQHPLWRDGWAWLLIAALIAVGLRTVNLNYSEFQGDEAKVMVRAAQALEGEEAIVFQHKKGPAQLALVMSGWRLTGIANEWMARLPFAWANILGVITVFLCGRRLGHPHAGGIAACLMAIEGYHVGFGRIVQYQSLVFVLGGLGLLCLLAYHATGHGSLVTVSAAFFAGGSLAHYDVILVLPAGLLLVGTRMWHDRRHGWRTLVPILTAAMVGLVLMGLFYVPFLRSPYVEYTSSYVSGRVGGHTYNNLLSSFELSTVYDSVYYLGIILLALTVQILTVWTRWGRAGLVSSSVLVLITTVAFVRPELLVFADQSLAWIFPTALSIGALLSPAQPMGIRAVWLWLGVSAVFYLFFVATPLTHVYTVFPAWTLLAGLGLASIGRWLGSRSKGALWVTSAIGVAFYVLCSSYAVMLFIDHTPEYRRTFPQFKSPVFWTPYDQMPTAGLFGFPYRAGWKVVGHLMDEGQLSGSYASNEKWKVTNYYTRQAVRLDCASPDMYITAVNVQDEVAINWNQIETEYEPAVAVTANDNEHPKLMVYRRDADSPVLTYQVKEHERLFDLGTTPERVARPASLEMGSVHMEEYTPREATIGGFAHLIGYRIDTEYAIPGGYVELTLVWQALGPAPIDYQVFTHLYDGQTMRGQLDGTPVCGNLPTSRWEPDQLFADPYRIPIRADAPPGPVPLTIGMYNLTTMERAPVLCSDLEAAGDTVYLTDIEIQSP